MESVLRKVLDGPEVTGDLVVQYSDLHPLHGGVAYEVSGSGRITRYRRGGDEREDRTLVPAQLSELVALLVGLAAWEQRSPERRARPDESRAYLRIAAGGEEAMIWEWFDELQSNDRVVMIVDELATLFASGSPESSAMPS